MRIVIIGAGVVGTATGKGFARRGHAVSFVDVNSRRIDDLRSEGLAASDTIDLSGPQALVLISVPTPSGPAPAGYNTHFVEVAAGSVGDSIRGADEFPIVALRSTLPPGTCEDLIKPILEHRSGRSVNDGFGLASNPEFLRAECALEDFMRPRLTVIGSRSKATRELLADLYAPFGGEVRTYGNPAMAELIKVTHNLYNATKISFFNEIWLLAEALGLDADAVSDTVSRSAEASWNREYGTKGGRPFGGACLPKDTRGFIGFAHDLGVPVALAQAVEDVNERLLTREAVLDLRVATAPVDPVETNRGR